jgi:hypothetical protein
MHKKFLFSTLFSFWFAFCLYGQRPYYHTFENIVLSAEASAINCFAQDHQGLIWMGSNRGLYSYDGFSAQAHISEETNTQVYCLLILNETYLCLGTDNGVFFYNYQTDQYEAAGVVFPTDVRAMAVCDSVLWIGSLNGLFRYNLQNKKLEVIPATEVSGLPHKTVYSIIQSGKILYIGTYNGFCKYLPDTGKFEKITLPFDSNRSNQFINVLLEDTLQKCIWIGTEGMLYKYIPVQKRAKPLTLFRNNSVKSLAIDQDKNLLVGTDNGLYVYNDLLRERANSDTSGNLLSDSELTLNFILDERARELYWECTRRTDLIRFGRFTGNSYVWQWKGGVKGGTVTDEKYNIYPIPYTELSANPNLTNEHY